MVPLVPTVGHFLGFCLQRKFPPKCSNFFFVGTPGRGGRVQKISADFLSRGPLANVQPKWDQDMTKTHQCDQHDGQLLMRVT